MIHFATEIAKEAIDLIKKFNSVNQLSIDKKSDGTLVSTLDKEIELFLRKKISERYPDHGIMGEEFDGDPDFATFSWIIDPIDGTHNFIRNTPIYGISIGIMDQHQFFAGVIAVPSTGEIFSAQSGLGCWNGSSQLTVSNIDTIEHCTLLFDSVFNRGTAPKGLIIEHLGRNVQ